MMKKCGIMICAAALLLSGCGGTSTAGNSIPAASSQQENAAQAQPAENSAAEAAPEQDAPESKDAITYDLVHFTLTLPDNYEDVSTRNETIASSTADPKIHFGLAYQVGYDPADDGRPADFGLDAIPEIMGRKTADVLSSFVFVDDDKAERTVSDSKEVDFLGGKMLREQGVLTTKDGDVTNQFQYTAYYGKFDIPEGYTGTPTMWFAFTQDGDADAAAALADSVFASAKEK